MRSYRNDNSKLSMTLPLASRVSISWCGNVSFPTPATSTSYDSAFSTLVSMFRVQGAPGRYDVPSICRSTGVRLRGLMRTRCSKPHWLADRWTVPTMRTVSAAGAGSDPDSHAQTPNPAEHKSITANNVTQPFAHPFAVSAFAAGESSRLGSMDSLSLHCDWESVYGAIGGGE